MKKIFRLFKFRLFRIVFVVLIITGGILFYQYRQNADNPVCKDCNLILISVDTLRPDHMGVYGYEKNTTPNIDKWAKNATVFTNMRTVVPSTYPSFSTLMTGISPFVSKRISNSTTQDSVSKYLIPIDNDTHTLAQSLSSQNYKSVAFINSAALDPNITNLNKGFNSYHVDYNEVNNEFAIKNRHKSISNINKAIQWIDKNKKSKFFLWVHLMEPHSPYVPTKKSECKFNKKFCNEITSKGLNNLELEREALQTCHDKPLPSEKVELFKTLYDGSIADMDKLVGELLNYIENIDINKNTIVIFYSDHGEGFDHNYYFMHSYVLYDSHLKIPFIVKVPGFEGKRNDSIYQNTLIPGSLLEILGIENQIPTKINVFNENDNSLVNQSYYYANTTLDKFAIQKENYKYIYSQKENTCLLNSQNEELYDLKNDPNELNNLLSKEPHRATQFKDDLLDYLHQHNLPNYVEYVQTENSDTRNRAIQQLKSLGY